ncbi:MAG: LysR family transcriptional regulator [Myxococcales bacterium]|nr:LysR family transcriptional regulator [Myxococcales bacterium]
MNAPSVDNLRCFLAAATSLNFRTAAKTVHLSPAAFGQRIAQLEAQLEAPLFARSTRSISLTPAGVALVPQARAAVAASEACLRVVKGELEALPMELVVGTRHELGMSWIVPALDTLKARFTRQKLNLYFGSGEDLLVRLRTREIDLAVTSTRLADPRLDAVVLHPERYVFVAARSLLAREPFSRRAHAARHTLIDAAPDLPLYRYWRDAPGSAEALTFADHWYLGTIEAIAWAVREGRGVAVLPEYLVARSLARKQLVELLPSVRANEDHFRLVFRADDARRALFEAIADTLRALPLR